MTVKRLLADLHHHNVLVRVDGEDLRFDAQGDDPPDHLLDAVVVLQTGVRAVLTGRRWFGFDAATGRPCGTGAYGSLNPNAKLPQNASYLCCEGDTVWDRIASTAREEMPFLFATTQEGTP